MDQNLLEPARIAFNRVGWFIPPYVQMQFIFRLQNFIDGQATFDQRALQAILAQVYSLNHLAPMVTERYPITPYVQDYKEIIAEAVEAHALGLDHIAVSGLMPVVEGAARKLADSRGVTAPSVKGTFTALADDCKNEVISQKIGAVGEILSMLDSFIEFTNSYLYTSSSNYPLSDNTNRHGTLHGAFTDADYGDPINFYKTIASIDMLCFISALRAHISWLAPEETPQSRALAAYYLTCVGLRSIRPATP